jgi:hypothetical protein
MDSKQISNRAEFFNYFSFNLQVFDESFDRTELKIKLYFDQNQKKVFFVSFYLFFKEINLFILINQNNK